ncbi:MAG: phospholipase D-like domain-containing protein [Planctomycetota bacterium]
MKRLPTLLLLAALAIPAACRSPRENRAPLLELIESAPIETTLDNADLRNTSEVWLEMFRSAKRTIDVAEFYFSNFDGSALEPIITEIEKSPARGVRVRLLAEKKFYKTYPDTLDRLAKVPGIDMRQYDISKMTGGVLHAKYFIIDGAEVFVGSQNFDWRALSHIQELGIRVRDVSAAMRYLDIYNLDWNLAAGKPDDTAKPDVLTKNEEIVIGGARVKAVFSPKDLLVRASEWDLPQLVEMLANARKTVRVQLLTYKCKPEDAFELEASLCAAAARGVDVRVLVANWSKRRDPLESLKRLVASGVKVKFMNIPEWTGGFIPFARVCHSKYMTVDGRASWLGTSNWEKDYFYKSRNAGFVIEDSTIAARLERFFDDNSSSEYAEILDPTKTYAPPKIGE